MLKSLISDSESAEEEEEEEEDEKQKTPTCVIEIKTAMTKSVKEEKKTNEKREKYSSLVRAAYLLALGSLPFCSC